MKLAKIKIEIRTMEDTVKRDVRDLEGGSNWKGLEMDRNG